MDLQYPLLFISADLPRTTTCRLLANRELYKTSSIMYSLAANCLNLSLSCLSLFVTIVVTSREQQPACYEAFP